MEKRYYIFQDNQTLGAKSIADLQNENIVLSAEALVCVEYESKEWQPISHFQELRSFIQWELPTLQTEQIDVVNYDAVPTDSKSIESVVIEKKPSFSNTHKWLIGFGLTTLVWGGVQVQEYQQRNSRERQQQREEEDNRIVAQQKAEQRLQDSLEKDRKSSIVQLNKERDRKPVLLKDFEDLQQAKVAAEIKIGKLRSAIKDAEKGVYDAEKFQFGRNKGDKRKEVESANTILNGYKTQLNVQDALLKSLKDRTQQNQQDRSKNDSLINVLERKIG